MSYKKHKVINRYIGHLKLSPPLSEKETLVLGDFWNLISLHAPNIRAAGRFERQEPLDKWRGAVSNFFGFSFSDDQAQQMIWGYSPHIVIDKEGKNISVNDEEHNRSNLRPAFYMLWYFFFSEKAVARFIAPDKFSSFGARKMKGTIKGLSLGDESPGHFWTYDVENEVIKSRLGVGGSFEKPRWGRAVIKESNFSLEEEFGNILFVIKAMDIVAENNPNVLRRVKNKI